MIGKLFSWLGGGTPAQAPIPDALWDETVALYPFLDALGDEERDRLRALCQDFLAEKEFVAAEGFALDDRICLEIAIQGCLPVLELGLAWYRGWHSVIVYPDEFVIPRKIADESGVVHEYDEVASGEAWGDGPLIVSWRDVQMTDDVYNVVIHEFAHKIDMRNGEPDGCPPLHKGMDLDVWIEAVGGAYEDFCRRVDAAPLFEDAADDNDVDLDSILDPYGATHPGEFFAVASESFFTAPIELREEYPALYAQFSLFFRQDPATRLLDWARRTGRLDPAASA
jgi:Mlc titration factor MtfA (ptsG expression regulator)